MKFIKACQKAYREAVKKMSATKEDAAVDLYLNKEIADIQVWSNGQILLLSSWIHLADLQSDGWEIEE